MTAEKPARRSAHRTQWAAQFAVASGLCKRGYEVAFTMGNHPNADLMVISPSEVAFAIDVKGLYRKNAWAVKAKSTKENLFYVLAYVPDNEANQFFILSQQQVNTRIDWEVDKARKAAIKKGKSPDKASAFTGLAWSFAAQFQDWNVLPA